MKAHLVKWMDASRFVHGPLPVVRLWRGKPSKELTRVDYELGVQKGLIPETTRVAGRHGLIGYVPGVFADEEIAAVIYKNQAGYDEMKATALGKWYGGLHYEFNDVQGIEGLEHLEGREFFVRRDVEGNRVSFSRQPVPFEGEVQVGTGYFNMLMPDMHWQGAHVLVRRHFFNEGVTEAQIAHHVSRYMLRMRMEYGELAAHLVRVDADSMIEFIHTDPDDALAMGRFVGNIYHHELGWRGVKMYMGTSMEHLLKSSEWALAKGMSHSKAQNRSFKVDSEEGVVYRLYDIPKGSQDDTQI